MVHRLLLFKWIQKEEKEELQIIEKDFKGKKEAIAFLDTIVETEFDIAKIFLGDSLVHTRDRKKHQTCDFS
jgi:hypothetical protein